jgi:CPA2 family monovalent cation:H+ antiporter-2
VVSLLRQANENLGILVRARYVAEIEELERVGADEVIPAEFETSIEILVRLLTRLGVPRHVVRVQEAIMRLGHYRALRGLGSSVELLAETGRLVAGGILENARVMEASAVLGRSLEEIDLRRGTGATVLNVVRGDEPLPGIDGSTRLQEGDLVVLYGSHEAIDRALDLFCPRALDGLPSPDPEEEKSR